MKYNVVVIYTLLAEEAERIVKHAEHVLRHNWNLYGFQRIGSGHETIVTDGFGNPYFGNRKLKMFGIAIAVPEHLDYRMVTAYLDCGCRVVNCEAIYRFAVI